MKRLALALASLGTAGVLVPAILIECGFMSNPRERALLQSSAYEWKIARGLVAGTDTYLGR